MSSKAGFLLNFILSVALLCVTLHDVENQKRIPPNAECADGQEFKQNDIKRLFDGGFSIKHFQYNYTHESFKVLLNWHSQLPRNNQIA